MDRAHNSERDCALVFHRREDQSKIGMLLRGSIDLHVHFDPDTRPRRFNAIETALIACEAGLAGLVLKRHSVPTADIATLVSEVVSDIAVFGGICLEYECGGLNVEAVEACAKMGGRVVWMPVFCSTNSKPLVKSKLGIDTRGDGISILEANGSVLPEVVDILNVVRDYDMVLATGHISAREILALVDKAKQLNVTKILVTHAMSRELSESVLQPRDREMLAHDGVLIEHTAAEMSITGEARSPKEVADAIRGEGARNCIMSTDFGAVQFPSVGEGMRDFINAMLRCGLSEEEIGWMVKQNPARLLGL